MFCFFTILAIQKALATFKNLWTVILFLHTHLKGKVCKKSAINKLLVPDLQMVKMTEIKVIGLPWNAGIFIKCFRFPSIHFNLFTVWRKLCDVIEG